MLQKLRDLLTPKFLGGDLEATLGSVEGTPSLGTVADLFKATGEVRLHLVRSADGEPVVTLELVSAEVPGDGRELACVQLSLAEAAKLERLLADARDAAGDGRGVERP